MHASAHACARLGADVVCYSFIVVDLHHLLLAGLPAHLRENSEIEFANENFVSTSINLKNKGVGDSCRDKTIEKTILRSLGSRTFSHGCAGRPARSRWCKSTTMKE